MLRLLKLEWSKFSKNNVIVLLTSFFALFFPASLYIGKLFPDDLPAFLPGKQVFFNFPTVWEYLGYAGNWTVFFFMGVMIIYTVTIEVSNKTMRQSIINGQSRQQFFFSKYLTILVLCLIITLYYTIITLIVGFTSTPNPSLSLAFENDMAIPRFFLMSFGYMNFAIFLAFMFRKSGIAVFFYLTYVMIIEMLIKWLVGINWLDLGVAVNFLPLNAIEDLMPMPWLHYADFFQNGDIDFPILLTYTEACIATAVYGLLFLGISYFSFMKRDI